MTDPRFRTLYKRLEDAPEPKADGFWIAVWAGDDAIQDYVSKGGKYVAHGRSYVAASAE